MTQIKIKPILGAPPEGGFYTKEEQDRYDIYVEKLKREGKYLTEGEELNINFQEYNKFTPKKIGEVSIGNFGIITPSNKEILP